MPVTVEANIVSPMKFSEIAVFSSGRFARKVMPGLMSPGGRLGQRRAAEAVDSGQQQQRSRRAWRAATSGARAGIRRRRPAPAQLTIVGHPEVPALARAASPRSRSASSCSSVSMPLGQHDAADLAGEGEQRGDEPSLALVVVHGPRQAGVELDDVRLQHEHVPQAGEPCTGVVHPPMRAPEPCRPSSTTRRPV
jgi:hypothetical protein